MEILIPVYVLDPTEHKEKRSCILEQLDVYKWQLQQLQWNPDPIVSYNNPAMWIQRTVNFFNLCQGQGASEVGKGWGRGGGGVGVMGSLEDVRCRKLRAAGVSASIRRGRSQRGTRQTAVDQRTGPRGHGRTSLPGYTQWYDRWHPEVTCVISQEEKKPCKWHPYKEWPWNSTI